jgi:hypothetical protein
MRQTILPGDIVVRVESSPKGNLIAGNFYLVGKLIDKAVITIALNSHDGTNCWHTSKHFRKVRTASLSQTTTLADQYLIMCTNWEGDTFTPGKTYVVTNGIVTNNVGVVLRVSTIADSSFVVITDEVYYDVGDEVQLKPNLTLDTKYGEATLLRGMLFHSNKIVDIVDDLTVELTEVAYSYASAMLEPVNYTLNLPSNKFRPVQVTFTIESLEELKALYAMTNAPVSSIEQYTESFPIKSIDADFEFKLGLYDKILDLAKQYNN